VLDRFVEPVTCGPNSGNILMIFVSRL